MIVTRASVRMGMKDLIAKQVSQFIFTMTVLQISVEQERKKERKKEMFRFVVFPIWQEFHVHLERRQMMHKVAAVFSLLRMEGSLTAPVPLLIITGLGAHLMPFTVGNGLIVVRKPDWKIQFLNENSKKVAVVVFLICVKRENIRNMPNLYIYQLIHAQAVLARMEQPAQ